MRDLKLVLTRRRRGEVEVYLRGLLLGELKDYLVNVSRFELLCEAGLEAELALDTKYEWAEVRYYNTTRWLPVGNGRKRVDWPSLRVYVDRWSHKYDIPARRILEILRTVAPKALEASKRPLNRGDL